jgi:hypothetical protein
MSNITISDIKIAASLTELAGAELQISGGGHHGGGYCGGENEGKYGGKYGKYGKYGKKGGKYGGGHGGYCGGCDD